MERFGEKLGLALKVTSISRGRLAASVSVDKSVVSRWLSDSVRPSGHNLTLITNLLRQELQLAFSLLTWELDYPDFARAIGAPEILVQHQPVPADGDGAAPVLPLQAISVSRAAVPREGWVFPGLYIGYRNAYANNGIVIVQALLLRLEGERLTARFSDGLFNYRGEALLLRGQLFVVMEETTRLDELLSMVLNGVSAPMADVLDGLIMGVAADRTSTPSCTTIVWQRQADVTGDEALDESAWSGCVDEVARINRDGRGRELMPPEFAHLVDNLVGVPRDGADLDQILRVPFTRSLSRASTAVLRPAGGGGSG